jgi:translation initiation factor eIF-2B subunit epsilon
MSKQVRTCLIRSSKTESHPNVAQTNDLQASLGEDSNGLVWPDDSFDLESVASDDDEDEANDRINGRLLRLGDTASDLELSDEGSVTGSSSDSDSDDNSDVGALGLSLGSSTTSLSHQDLAVEGKSAVADLADAQALREFSAEVEASLARSFSEDHAVDDAAVELKTLRMASNVPLRRVREAVVAKIVNTIPLVADDLAKQRKAIAQVIERWGDLIDQIGGADAVETVQVLQVCDVSISIRHD